MTHKSTALHHGAVGQGIVPPLSWLKRILTALDNHNTRVDLSKLSDQHLRDIGLTRQDSPHELPKSVWDAPNHWRAGHENRDDFRRGQYPEDRS